VQKWEIILDGKPYTHLNTRFMGHTYLEMSKCAKGTEVAQWLRYCATNRKVAGSIPEYALSSGAVRTCLAECSERSSE